jgi:hypothetical protein
MAECCNPSFSKTIEQARHDLRVLGEYQDMLNDPNYVGSRHHY